MGKAGRAACIFTPLALTIASFVCVVLINLGGYSKSSSTLSSLYFFQVDFSNYTSGSSSSELSQFLTVARQDGYISDFYQVHLWNYCNGSTDETSGSVTRKVTWCSARTRNSWFDPLDVWNIEGVLNASTVGQSSTVIGQLQNNITSLEESVLDKSARNALKTYQKVSKWVFTAYFASLWFLLAAVVFGVLAVFTRFMSFVTWVISIISTILVGGASLTATIMFSVLVGALKTTLSGHNIEITLSTQMLAVTWLATLFSLAATLFWLFSACWCSGKGNPHHVKNRDPPAADFGYAQPAKHGRNLKVGKTAGYEPVDSPYGGHREADNVPLTQMAAPYGRAEPHRDSGAYAHGYGDNGVGAGSSYHQHTGAYEPYRHN